eukprot:TRINITY_DN38388_c0_g1_i1.p1 TRINITY_DN38388_c0_g1~~TRINITY_DN38388_c0_g1_i1.p1  ORF type:complete len:575 (-),score=99.21 TRINITY_DN38388_c0_g1_i1:254-1978(-)
MQRRRRSSSEQPTARCAQKSPGRTPPPVLPTQAPRLSAAALGVGEPARQQPAPRQLRSPPQPTPPQQLPQQQQKHPPTPPLDRPRSRDVAGGRGSIGGGAAAQDPPPFLQRHSARDAGNTLGAQSTSTRQGSLPPRPAGNHIFGEAPVASAARSPPVTPPLKKTTQPLASLPPVTPTVPTAACMFSRGRGGGVVPAPPPPPNDVPARACRGPPNSAGQSFGGRSGRLSNGDAGDQAFKDSRGGMAVLTAAADRVVGNETHSSRSGSAKRRPRSLPATPPRVVQSSEKFASSRAPSSASLDPETPRTKVLSAPSTPATSSNSRSNRAQPPQPSADIAVNAFPAPPGSTSRLKDSRRDFPATPKRGGAQPPRLTAHFQPFMDEPPSATLISGEAVLEVPRKRGWSVGPHSYERGALEAANALLKESTAWAEQRRSAHEAASPRQRRPSSVPKGCLREPSPVVKSRKSKDERSEDNSGISFRGDASLASVHFIDQDMAPGDHLSRKVSRDMLRVGCEDLGDSPTGADKQHEIIALPTVPAGRPSITSSPAQGAVRHKKRAPSSVAAARATQAEWLQG